MASLIKILDNAKFLSKTVFSESTPSEGSSLTNGLQAFYKLDDTSDSSGNGNTLTNNGDVSFASGKIGNAAVFDGSNYLATNSSSFPAGNSDRSVSAWFKTNNAGNYNILLSYGSPQENSSFGLSVTNSGDIEFAAYSNDFQGNTFVADGNWHHVVGVNSSNNGRSLYLDGILIATNSNPINTQTENSELKIGEWTVSFGGSMNGQIDAVGIWNRALSDAEVAELYNTGTGLELN